jgi:integrase/recombinase XerD
MKLDDFPIQLVKYCNRRDYLDLVDNIKMKFEMKQKVASDLLTGAEIMALINAARNDRDAAIIAVLYDSGCRIGELLSCKIKHVDFERDECNITFPKSKTVARSSLLIFAKGYLETYLKRHPARNDIEAPLFVTENLVNVGTKAQPIRKYKALEHDTVLMILKRTTKLAGVKKRVHPHLFRHTRATELSTSLTEAELKTQFGWASGSNVPSLYIHLRSCN